MDMVVGDNINFGIVVGVVALYGHQAHSGPNMSFLNSGIGTVNRSNTLEVLEQEEQWMPQDIGYFIKKRIPARKIRKEKEWSLTQKGL